MQFDDIKIGLEYEVNYVDKNYPCDCECHTNDGIIHIDACCSDRSYSGIARCYAKMNDPVEICYFLIGKYRTISLFPASVIRPYSVMDNTTTS